MKKVKISSWMIGATFLLSACGPLALKAVKPGSEGLALDPLGKIPGSGLQLQPLGDYRRFSYTGSDQTFTVPAGVSTVGVRLWGAGGGGYYFSNDISSDLEFIAGRSSGGGGGYVSGVLAIDPNQVYTVIVGQGGQSGGTSRTYGGGGASSFDHSKTSVQVSASGGGRTAFRSGSADLLTAGGGGGGWGGGGRVPLAGGARDWRYANHGGGGGGQEGGAASCPARATCACVQSSFQNLYEICAQGGAAAASGSGSRMMYVGKTTSEAPGGSSYQGGDGFPGGSGGGGGYFGGGGGYADSAGGGGSGYVGTATNAINLAASSDGTGAAAGANDVHYIGGVAVGGSQNAGGNGDALIYWGVSVTGVSHAGATLRVDGFNLNTSTTVTVNGQPCSSPSYIPSLNSETSIDRITCKVPDGLTSGKTYPVVVSVPGVRPATLDLTY